MFRRLLDQEPDYDPKQSLVSVYNQKAPASEAYRMLRTNINFSAGGSSIKVIEVTSSFPGEGKSLTACNLAIAFAQAGESVVLVDADMRRASVHKKFEIPLTRGLSECLVTGDVDPSLKDGPVEGLRIMTAGTLPPNPSELLHGQHMDKLIEVLRGRTDRVIIDAPPVLAVTDATIIAPKSDGVLMVLNIEESDKHAAKRAVASLRAVNARLLGVVLTGIKTSRRGYGYGNYYSGYYYYESDYYGADDVAASDEGGRAGK